MTSDGTVARHSALIRAHAKNDLAQPQTNKPFARAGRACQLFKGQIMTALSFKKVVTATVLTGAMGACSLPYVKVPQVLPAPTETAFVQPVAPVAQQAAQQQVAPAAAPSPTAVVTPVAETGPTAAEIAAEERRERRERREERRERRASDDDDGDRDRDRDGGWNP